MTRLGERRTAEHPQVPMASAAQYLHYFYFHGATLEPVQPLPTSVESQIFWLTATVTWVLAFGFSIRQRRLAGEFAKSASPELARSQEKDNWLTCVVVWSVVFSGHAGLSETLQVLGSLILAWVAWRTLRRVAILRR